MHVPQKNRRGRRGPRVRSAAVVSDAPSESMSASSATAAMDDALTTPASAANPPDAVWIDRDLSWIEFNRRVLAEALDDRTPLLERVKFLAIFTSNLDEFFMKRIAVL